METSSDHEGYAQRGQAGTNQAHHRLYRFHWLPIAAREKHQHETGRLADFEKSAGIHVPFSDPNFTSLYHVPYLGGRDQTCLGTAILWPHQWQLGEVIGRQGVELAGIYRPRREAVQCLLLADSKVNRRDSPPILTWLSRTNIVARVAVVGSISRTMNINMPDSRPMKRKREKA